MPIKLSGELVEAARSSAKLLHRSLTGQIEHWASIGRAMEAQLSGEALARMLERVGGAMRIGRVAEEEQRRQLMGILAEFLGQPASEATWLKEVSARGVPLYGSVPGEPGKIVRLAPDGSRERVTSLGEALP